MPNANDYLEILRIASIQANGKWWPKYVYHYTDIHNAVSILETGKVFSRNRAREIMINENASLEVIAQTPERIKDFVRFYFRPKTPTQYRNEGYIPKNLRSYEGSNVPVPIFFAFEAKDMLAKEDSMFSEISLAKSNSSLTNDIEDFKKFDFRKIYSDGYYNGEALTPYRNAEMVIPNECDLKHLKHIWCRTNAEYNSLCFMLKEKGIYNQYKELIGVKENNNDLFFKNSIYISQVNLNEDNAKILYKNSDLLNDGEMNLKFIVNVNDLTYPSKTIKNQLITEVRFSKEIISEILKSKNYIFEIYFDDSLVYKCNYSYTDDQLNDLPY